jgi:methylmalonyl-CoA/ethylmalonyl-CoA epimerase
MTDPIDLDHVALASQYAWDNLSRYRADLGGEWLGGGVDPGYNWWQVRFANGMRIELLEPIPGHPIDFLRRFLAHSGPGPHHFTFMVPDIVATIEDLGAAGYEAININLGNERWQEAFLHPKQAHGIVIQLGQSTVEQPPDPADDGDLPFPRHDWRATLVRTVQLVASLEDALGLYAGVLGGSVTDQGQGPDGAWADVAWPGPGRVRFLEPSAEAPLAWMGRQPGRIWYLEFRCPDPAGVPGAERIGDDVYEIPPERNLGTRLRLSAE